MSNLEDFFDDLNEKANKMFTYKPMTDEEYQISCVNDIAEWAFKIASEWNGKEPGSAEDRAHQADDILAKCQELKELIAGLGEL